ncbi:MAG: hypothetical protein II562_02385 [Prevotella sp.]|nr:hypothetical protein [Prevotella sp.]
MIKRILFILSLMCVMTTDMMAQVRGEKEHWREPFDLYVGPKVGATYSNITKLGGDPVIFGTLGGFVEVFFTDRLGMNIELSMTHEGSKNVKHTNSAGAVGEYDYNFWLINTDYKLKYYFTKEICVFTGFHFGTFTHAKAKLHGGSTGNIKSHLHRQGAIPVGLSYETEKFSVEGVYHFPLRKLAKKDGKAEEIMGDAKTQLIELKFGYKIKLF